MNPQSQPITINFLLNCFSETYIQISQSIVDSFISAETILNYNQFSTKYFRELSSSEKVIDLLSPLISSYPNSDFDLFLSVILKNHVIDAAQSLIDSNEKFEKYKKYLLNIVALIKFFSLLCICHENTIVFYKSIKIKNY